MIYMLYALFGAFIIFFIVILIYKRNVKKANREIQDFIYDYKKKNEEKEQLETGNSLDEFDNSVYILHDHSTGNK